MIIYVITLAAVVTEEPECVTTENFPHIPKRASPQIHENLKYQRKEEK